MDWPASMTAYGVTVQRETLEEAWENWWGPWTSSQRGWLLMKELREVALWVTYHPDARNVSTGVWSRIADRMLQRARMAGVIRFNGKEWEKVE